MTLAFDANHADSNRANGSDGGNPANTSQANESANTNTSPARRTELGFLIQFLANEEFMAKLDEVKALLSNKMPNGTFESVFEVLMNEFIDHHSPEKRTQRREKRRTEKAEKQNEKHAGKRSSESGRKRVVQRVVERAEQHDGKRDTAEQSENNGTANKSHNPRETKTTQKRTRHIPASIRDKVFARDNARCTYVGKNGKRCGSTHSLQIDHIKPFARGGPNTLSNLRLLCGKHNRHEAKRILGADVMNQYNRRE